MSNGVTPLVELLMKRVRPSGLNASDCGAGTIGIVLATVAVLTWTSSTPAELATYKSPMPFAETAPESVIVRSAPSAPLARRSFPVFTRVPVPLVLCLVAGGRTLGRPGHPLSHVPPKRANY